MQSIISNPFHKFLHVSRSERQIGCRRRNHQRHSWRFGFQHEIVTSKNDGRKGGERKAFSEKNTTFFDQNHATISLSLPSNLQVEMSQSFCFPPCIGTFGKEKKFIVTFIVPSYDFLAEFGETSSPHPQASPQNAEQKKKAWNEMEWKCRKKADYFFISLLFLVLRLKHFAMLILSLAWHRKKQMEGLVA